MDMRVVAVRATQAELHTEIERLSAGTVQLFWMRLIGERISNAPQTRHKTELQLFLSTADPPVLEPAIARLSAVKKRLATAAATLKVVQDRLDRVQGLAVARAFGTG
ncbi:hypothetical protein HK104_010320 [Borealophlyctis nickersoniae]|nr:hypothetical protein HK104_010320 [Borealophlyctis nickersoniae]